MTGPAPSCTLPWCTSATRGPHDIHQNHATVLHGVTFQLVRCGEKPVSVISNAKTRAATLTPPQKRQVCAKLLDLADLAETSNVALGLVATGGAR